MLLAVRHGRLKVFIGTVAALFFMTLGSALTGYLVASSAELLESSVEVMDIVATVLFSIFAVQLLREAYILHEQEKNEAEMTSLLGGGSLAHSELTDAEETLKEVDDQNKFDPVRGFWGPIWQTFTMMFVAEWGDRSMFATIALATQHNPGGVIVGAMLGHSLANAMAVIGGAYLATFISEKIMALCGGVVFSMFALGTAYEAWTQQDIFSVM